MKTIAIPLFLAAMTLSATAQTKATPPQYKAPAAEPVAESRTLENAPEAPELPAGWSKLLVDITKRSRPIARAFMFSGCGRETICWVRFART
jgi:hypothetical protein